jgi:hypothetical protein
MTGGWRKRRSIASRRSFDFAQDDGKGALRTTKNKEIKKGKDAKKSSSSAQQVLTGTKSRIFSFLITGCRGHPLPKEVWNPRWVPHQIKFSPPFP